MWPGWLPLHSISYRSSIGMKLVLNKYDLLYKSVKEVSEHRGIPDHQNTVCLTKINMVATALVLGHFFY